MSRKIPAEDVIKDIKEVLSHEEIPTVANYLRKGKYKYRVVHRIAPDWTAFVESLGLTYRRPPSYRLVSEEDLRTDLLKVFEETGDTRIENYSAHGKYDPIVVRRVYGGWNKMLKKLGYSLNMHKDGDVCKEDIEAEYIALEKKLGRPVTAALFRKYSSYSQPIIDRLYGSFSGLQRALGRRVDGRFVSDEEILENLRMLGKKYGIVSRAVYDDEGLVSDQTVITRFGSLKKACEIAGANFDNTTGSSKLFRQCMKIVAELLGDNYTVEQTFDWLRNPKTGSKLRLDAYYPDKHLAIEIDGVQHYVQVPGWSQTKEQFEAAQERDRAKERLCQEHGIKLIRIRKPSKRKIKEKLGVA